MQEEKNFFQRNMKWVVIVGLVIILAMWVVGGYNSLVGQNEAVTAQWAQIESQLQRRFDLVPNLVETVKGVAKQETAVYTAIADARTRYAGATTPDERAKAASQYESALGRLLVITENYPVLQSAQSYKDLMVAIEGTENRLSVERKKYNEAVQVFDSRVKSFPTTIIAKIFGFGERAYFEINDEAKINPKVQF